MLIDYKGESTFDGFEKLKHTVEIISNLSSQDMIDRLSAVLRGEVERRQRLRSDMGMKTIGKKFRDARQYLKARERGADIPPFPTLLVVTDEFTALLKEHPEFKEDYEHLARQGRSDRICLMLATQSLTGVSVGQLLSNCGWKIAMKTASGADSAAVIETKDAYHLEHPGEGYLKVGGAEPRYFRGASVYDPYFPPDAISGPAGKSQEGGGVNAVAPFSATPVPVPGLNEDEESRRRLSAPPRKSTTRQRWARLCSHSWKIRARTSTRCGCRRCCGRGRSASWWPPVDWSSATGLCSRCRSGCWMCPTSTARRFTPSI